MGRATLRPSPFEFRVAEIIKSADFYLFLHPFTLPYPLKPFAIHLYPGMTTANGDTLKAMPADTEFTMNSGENTPERVVPHQKRPVAGVVPAQGGIITVQPLRRSEMQPSYAQNLGLDDVNHGFYGTFINCIGGFAGSLGQFPCCPCPNPFKQVRQGSVGLVSRFGQFYQSVDPGLVKINPCSESLRIVDVKIQLITVPQQRVTTRDNVSLELDSVIYWHVSNPYRAAFGIQDVK